MPLSISTSTTPSYRPHSAPPFSLTDPLPPMPIHHAFGGALTLSGTSGFTSVTTLNNSSTTLSPVLLPASLIFFNCSSASRSASSSAFLLPLVCYRSQKKIIFIHPCSPLDHIFMCDIDVGGYGRGALVAHLLLEFFEFVVFLFAVFFDFFLGFGFGVFDSFGTVCGEGHG